MASLGSSRVLSDGINRISGPFVAYGRRRSIDAHQDNFDYDDWTKFTSSGREEEEEEEEDNDDAEREVRIYSGSQTLLRHLRPCHIRPI